MLLIYQITPLINNFYIIGLSYFLIYRLGSPHYWKNIDYKLKQIQQKYNSLINLKSFDKNTLIVDKSKPTNEEVQKALEDAQRKEYYLNLIKN